MINKTSFFELTFIQNDTYINIKFLFCLKVATKVIILKNVLEMHSYNISLNFIIQVK